MSTTSKRCAIDLPAKIHRALEDKALATGRCISALVVEAVRLSLIEDARDLAAFEERRSERSLDFKRVVERLNEPGR